MSSLQVATHQDEDEVCWICLDGNSEGRVLQRMPCKCPRYAHARCMARWQLRSAGTRKETHCEFCDMELPAWKESLQINLAAPPSTRPVMKISLHGATKCFEVEPGPEGYKRFVEAIRQAYGLPTDSQLSITFTCEEPLEPSSKLVIHGEGAYDAAVTCTTLSAVRRRDGLAGTSPTQSTAGGSDKPAPKLGRLVGSVFSLMNSLRCITID